MFLPCRHLFRTTFKARGPDSVQRKVAVLEGEIPSSIRFREVTGFRDGTYCPRIQFSTRNSTGMPLRCYSSTCVLFFSGQATCKLCRQPLRLRFSRIGLRCFLPVRPTEVLRVTRDILSVCARFIRALEYRYYRHNHEQTVNSSGNLSGHHGSTCWSAATRLMSKEISSTRD